MAKMTGPLSGKWSEDDTELSKIFIRKVNPFFI
jgi:hypothetical protein